MDLQALTATVERELQQQHVPFERRHLQEFLEETCPLCRDDTPDPVLLATMFLKRCRVVEALRGGAAVRPLLGAGWVRNERRRPGVVFPCPAGRRVATPHNHNSRPGGGQAAGRGDKEKRATGEGPRLSAGRRIAGSQP
jgi:hypothetical protein